MVRQKTNPENAEIILDYEKEKRGDNCEVCGRRASQWHHALFPDKKGEGWRTTIYNLCHVCDECHGTNGGTTCRVKGWEWKQEFFWKQYGRYGLAFLVWIANVPLKVNEYKELIKEAYADTETDSGDRLRQSNRQDNG